MGLLKELFDPSLKELRAAEKFADHVLAKESSMEALDDTALKAAFQAQRDRYASGASLEDIMVDVFAIVREVGWRTRKEKAFKVQVMGAYVLHHGNIAEMRTGEGKTLTSTFPACLNAIAGKGVHIVTVNEYLAARDNEEMGLIYSFLGITSSVNIRELSKAEKKAAYAADIMYTTNAEIGFDYLRDHMVIYKEEMVQRPLAYAIIDEVDSILIDEARTPLIISGGQKSSQSMYLQADMAVKGFKATTDYVIDVKLKSITLTEEGIRKLEAKFGVENLYDIRYVSLLHRVNQAMRANFIMEKDVDYVVQNGEVIIVDPFTGRLMQGRQFSEGLHQALEAKEKVDVKKETTTLATITYQNYFRMYQKLAGMTGTAKTEEEEFRNIYNMYVVEIPTNQPIIRQDMPDLLYATMKAKYAAIAKEIKERHQQGQPILVGTISIESSELLSDLLTKAGVKHNVLNAKQHEREAEIVASAGQLGSVTIATNMAGRGTDIKLGPGVVEQGGLAIIGTERHEARRIDNQLRGRAGRQGDPGYSRFYLSADDELLVRFGGDRFKSLVERIAGTGDVQTPIESTMISKTIESSQKRIEGNNFDQRKTILQYDDVIRQQREIIYQQREELLLLEDITSIVQSMFHQGIDAMIAQYTEEESSANHPAAWEPKLNVPSLVAQLNQEWFGGSVRVEDLPTEQPVAQSVFAMIEAKIDAKLANFPPVTRQEFYKVVTLRVVDTYWTEHIDRMSGLRQSIRLQAYAQVNPLREYQAIGFEWFNQLIQDIGKEVTKFLLRAEIRQNLEREQVNKPVAENSGKETPKKKGPIKADKVGRNDLCPCGSGKKFKQCHGR
jgi:preprotein translocase subunit SecA